MTIKQLAMQSTTWISVKYLETTGSQFSRHTKEDLILVEEEIENLDHQVEEVAIEEELCHQATSALNAMNPDTGKLHYSLQFYLRALTEYYDYKFV